MLDKEKKENQKLVPLRRFADGRYSPAYLSILVQRKTLKAKKIGRNYFTTQEWFNDYLNLHARESKRELNVAEVEDKTIKESSYSSPRPNNSDNANDKIDIIPLPPMPHKDLAYLESATQDSEYPSRVAEKELLKDNELTTNPKKAVSFFVTNKTLNARLVIDQVKSETVNKLSNRLWAVRLITVSLLMVFAIISIGRYYPPVVAKITSYSNTVYYDIFSHLGLKDPKLSSFTSADNITEKIGRVAGITESANSSQDQTGLKIAIAKVFTGIRTHIAKAWYWLEDMILLDHNYQVSGFSGSMSNSDQTATSTEGIVIVPVKQGENAQELKNKISKMFSDRVIVNPDDSGRSGIVKPIFGTETSTQDYLFMMVPVNNYN